ncbi:glutaredoxin [Culex quinquefasciatus]|uniref:Glutaredoxin n=1 Tax=Culex quinquefasciatus TaxID=7176 RepID=B0WMX8_CULQU|nr:glutaredoxin [Culex quinquefasciatus]|eukprot:XP_001850062.1 glutaredoxin [Culex quinquefasciatus]
MTITNVTSVDQYNILISSPTLTVALFSADWAEQCKQILAVMTKLAKQFSAVQFVDLPGGGIVRGALNAMISRNYDTSKLDKRLISTLSNKSICLSEIAVADLEPSLLGENRLIHKINE